MTHLTKLSERLSKQLIPKVFPISTIETIDINKLEVFTKQTVSITKKVLNYDIPSLLMTANHYGLGSLSSNQISLSLSAFVIHKNLEKDK